MKIGCLFLSLMVIVFFVGCEKNSKKRLEPKEINNFISKYETADFTEFKNAFVAVRQRNLKNIVYIVQNVSTNDPAYIVKYDKFRDTITEIDRTALEKKGVENYYSQKEISRLIVNFRKYDFALLQVDSNNNVFINPWQIGEPATLLRLNKDNTNKTVKIGFVYKKYNHRWYIKN